MARRGVWVVRALAVMLFACIGAALFGAVAEAGSPPLDVSQVAPSAVAAGASRMVTVTGTSFKHGMSVTVSGTGVTASSTTLQSSTKLTTTLTATGGAALGKRTLTVHLGSASASLVDGVTVNPAPTLSAASPSRVAGTGTKRTVSLVGTHFQYGLKVAIAGGGITVGPAVMVSSTIANVPITVEPFAALGARAVTVTNPDGGRAKNSTILVVNPLPTVTSISTPPLSQNESIVETIAGTDFQAGATVFVGPGISTSVTSVTPTHVTVRLTVSRKAAIGVRTVKVTNPDGGAASMAAGVKVAYIAVLSKWAVGDGAVNWTTTLARPTFSTLPSFSFTGTGVALSGASLNARHQVVLGFTISPTAPATWRDMKITQGTTTWSVPDGLKVRLAPVVTSVTSLGQGATGQTVSVKGANFEVCGTVEPAVSISGAGVTINKVSTAFGDLMYLKLSVAQTAPVGVRDVTITNCDSGGTATSTGVFDVLAHPAVTAIPPVAVGVSRVETVTGSGFTTSTTLTLSGAGVGLSHVTYLSPTQLTVNVTASASAATGPRDVTATNLDGSSSVAPGVLVIDPLPTITSLSPSFIAPGDSRTQTVFGTGFDTGAEVVIGPNGSPDPDLTVGTVTVVSSTELQFSLSATPSLSAGPAQVTVTNTDGGQASTSTFTTGIQLDAPVVSSVDSSATTAGSINVSFTGSANAPGGETYTAMACTNAAMTSGCVSQASYGSGDELVGLAQGMSYYAEVTADTSPGYLAATSSTAGPALATVRLVSPGSLTLNYGATAGSLNVAFAASLNAAPGQTYTVSACTNPAMTSGCVTDPAFSSGSDLTGLAFTPGAAGTLYYVAVTANASPGYLASVPTQTSHPDTSQYNKPTAVNASTGSSHGQISVTFTSATGSAPSSYTATACLNSAMTTGCVSATSFTSGSQITGLATATGYFVTVTSVSTNVAFAANVSSPPQAATSS